MTTSNRFAYIQARLQARHGDRPSEDQWRQLEATPDLGSYLQLARSTGLQPWVAHLPADADVHQMERSLRRDWRLYAAAVAAWAPGEWRGAIEWMGSLPTLPYLAHLARGREVHRWMLDDPQLAVYAQEDLEQRGQALQAGAFAELADAVARGRPPLLAWLDAWMQRWPRVDARTGLALERVQAAIAEHIAGILADPLEQSVGPGLRRRLAQRLTLAFRHEAGRVGAIFAHLALVILDLERLQGGLALRTLFPDPLARPQWA